ncbi:TonB-dependent receptor [Porticoccus sp. GXU_MW_L64]
MSLLVWRKIQADSSSFHAPDNGAAGGSVQPLIRYYVAAILLLLSPVLWAGDEGQIDKIIFNIPQQRADSALIQFAEQADLTLIIPFDDIQGKLSTTLVGEYSIVEGINLLLSETGLQAAVSNVGQLSFVNKQPVKGREDMHKQNKLSVGIIAALSAFFGGTVNAEDAKAAGQISEEIVVKGIRGSLKRSLDIKRESGSFVDAISSEDIGKFPDQNVAEALQRISGVAIERNGGEGQFITVRGLGPEFNTVLVNGRTMATDNAGREFSFDVLSSDIVAAAEVHKTPVAHLQEGGIGATVNIKTARPLDRAGTTVSVSAGGIFDSLRSDVSPDLSAFYSFSNDDSTVGFLASIAYSDRKSRIEQVGTSNFRNGSLDIINGTPDSTGLDASSLETLSDVFFPGQLTFTQREEERERLVASSTFQIRPSDSVEITIDGLYSQFDLLSEAVTYSEFFTRRFLDVELDENRTVVGFNRPGSEFLAANPDIADQSALQQNDNVVDIDDRFTDTYQVGGNLKWELSDGLSMAFDLSYSQAEALLDDPFVVVGSLAQTSPRFDLNEGDTIPSISNLGPITDASLLRAHFSRLREIPIEDEIFEGRWDIDWTFEGGALQGIEAGLLFSNREKSTDRAQSPGRCAFCGYRLPIPANLVQPFSFDGFLGGVSGAENAPGEFFSFNPREIINFLSQPENISNPIRQPGLTPEEFAADVERLLALPGNGFAPVLEPSSSTNVEEEVFAVYVGGSWGGQIGDMPWSGNLGLRVVRTETTSTGFGQEVISVNPVPGDDALDIEFTDPSFISVSNSYTNVLPSLNFKLNVSDDTVVRFAASNTVTRPTLTSLGTNNSFNNQFTLPQSSGGNPNLEPFESWNFDLGVEWYYSDIGFVGASVFHKEFDEFLETQTLPVSFGGPGGSLVFDDTRTRNGEEGSITGFELAGQHTFDNLPGFWSGLGVSANYTRVSSSVERAEGSAAASCDYNGLSPNSLNVSGFYERGPWRARLAHNWRDEFLQLCFGAGSQPENRRDFGQTDFSMGYQINDNVEIYAEGINIFREDVEEFSVLSNRFVSFDRTGRRFSLGLRATF